jgi:hypothetical protein
MKQYRGKSEGEDRAEVDGMDIFFESSEVRILIRTKLFYNCLYM